MRERLTELVFDGYLASKRDGNFCADIADYLLANGVIVPPVKVGQTVYVNGFGVAEPHCVASVQANIGISGFVRWRIEAWLKGEFLVSRDSGFDFWLEDEFGKTVFLTKEEAERALAERREK